MSSQVVATLVAGALEVGFLLGAAAVKADARRAARRHARRP